MHIKKYKYYFRKPKSEITKDILSWLCIAGAVTIAATSPYFVQNILRSYKKMNQYPKKKISSAFDRLRRKGLLLIQSKNGQICISFTKKGRMHAGIFQIDQLNIRKPKKWDRKWRLLLFDISENKRIIRDILRGKLKELGFCPFQESVWIYPYSCDAEMELLKDFFGLSDEEMQLVVADKLENDSFFKNFFNL